MTYDDGDQKLSLAERERESLRSVVVWESWNDISSLQQGALRHYLWTKLFDGRLETSVFSIPSAIIETPTSLCSSTVFGDCIEEET
jgi:hypothetical protein